MWQFEGLVHVTVFWKSPLYKDVIVASTYNLNGFKTPEILYFVHFIERFENKLVYPVLWASTDTRF